jgi:DNA-binding Xre family transcriptional regulator
VPGPPGVDPRLGAIQLEALRSRHDDLRAELIADDALQSGMRPPPDLRVYADLPIALFERRIAAGLSQRQLAERLGIKEQQIQAYEATEYSGASFTRLKAVIDALESAPLDTYPPDSLIRRQSRPGPG